MDLSTLDTTDQANKGSVLELRGPDGTPALKSDGSPVTITLLGEDSDDLTKLANRQTNRFLRSGGQAKITAEIALANETERLIAATVSWDGVGLGEDETKLTPASARQLYEMKWARDQVREFISDRANFSKASPKT